MENALATGYGLIEGPVWDSERGLLFSDVLNGGVFCLDQSGNVEQLIEHRKGIGGMALHEKGIVVGGRNIALKAFDKNSTQVLLDRDLNAHNVGYNDLTTDSDGRIYAGSLGSPVFDPKAAFQPGQLFLIDVDGSSRVVAEDVLLTNGLGFSPDGQTLYHSDSRRQAVFFYNVLSDGSLGAKLHFADIEKGSPDGLAVSSDGRVWVAIAGGGLVIVFDSEGNSVDSIDVPLPMVTSVCLGGDDLCDLFVVTGSDGTGDKNRGSVFRYAVDTPGLPVPISRVRTAKSI